MIDRSVFEEMEAARLSPFASLSSRSRGRKIPEPQDALRTIFQRDRDRIIHAKSFRRLKDKTQVFLSPEGDHYRTRLTHTLEVSQIARSLARALRLNEDLTEAIALAHDLGHTPFGHCGEKALHDVHPGGFVHAQQSIRVVEHLERRRGKSWRGLNLSYEVLDGIANHSGSDQAQTLEGQIIKFADRIAYINHDIDDAMRAGILQEEQFSDYWDILGRSTSERINTMILDVIQNSVDRDRIAMSDGVYEATMSLRSFLFQHLYYNPKAKGEEGRAEEILRQLYGHFSKHPEDMSEEYFEDFKSEGQVAVKDYIAGMSDRFAVTSFKAIFLPKFWQ